MWDNNAPLQLLKTMPSKLNQENLEKIQLLIDADKYKNSIISGFDLCGIFAPFCRGCDRTSIYPCAVSYIRMLQAEGMNIEIDASPSYYHMPQPYKPTLEVPQTKPRTHSVSYEQRPARKPIERKYSEPKSRVPKEVKPEIAVTEVEPEPPVQPVQPVVEEKKVVEKPVEVIPVEVKPEIAVVEQEPVLILPEEVVVQNDSEVVVPVYTEEVLPYKEEKEEGFEEKPLDVKKLRIAVARRKLNF